MNALTAAARARARLVAFACALLCGLSLISPAAASAVSAHPHHHATVKIVALPTPDQGVATVRVDAPISAAYVPVESGLVAVTESRPAGDDPGDGHSVEVVSSRGPPGTR